MLRGAVLRHAVGWEYADADADADDADRAGHLVWRRAAVVVRR
jgi:hypothetical protein